MTITSYSFIVALSQHLLCAAWPVWRLLRASSRPVARQCRRRTTPTNGASGRLVRTRHDAAPSQPKVCQRQDVQIAESTSGQARCDLLQQPAVAVGIAERRERAVAAMLGIRTANPEPPKQVGLVRAGVHPTGVVEHLADRDTAAKQLFAGGLDVGDDQVQALGGAGCRRGDVLAE